jgi:hypothetical protein
MLHRRPEEGADAGTAGSESLGAGPAKVAPNPAAAVFTVQVIPADAIEKQEYRQLTLHFTMPASEFKVTPSESGQYVARLEIGAVGYSDGRQASSNGSQGAKVVVNFDGASDPRIANSTITATLTLNLPEHGKSRWLYVSVRDVATGQSGDMVIPMGQVKMPGAQ